MQLQMHKEQSQSHVEDNVDSLLSKLEGQGKKVKILTAEEEEQ